jgi:FkbM family methyltransferase
MSVRQRGLNLCIEAIRGAIAVVGGRNAGSIEARIAERIAPTIQTVTRFGAIRFFCPGALPEYRARALLTKEPETIAWIDTFSANDVFWDIGANVGSYSLYAALKQVRTLAFEPSAGNYFLLNRNIEINQMHDRISAFCLALSDDTRLASLHMQNTELGGAQSSFSEPFDWQGRAYAAAFQQAMIGFDVDGFIRQFSPLFPTHMKIDVDGREDKVVAGAQRTLEDARLKSVLIELDGGREDYTAEVIRSIEKLGLALAQSGQTLEIDGGPAREYLYLFKRRDG